MYTTVLMPNQERQEISSASAAKVPIMRFNPTSYLNFSSRTRTCLKTFIILESTCTWIRVSRKCLSYWTTSTLTQKVMYSWLMLLRRLPKRRMMSLRMKSRMLTWRVMRCWSFLTMKIFHRRLWRFSTSIWKLRRMKSMRGHPSMLTRLLSSTPWKLTMMSLCVLKKVQMPTVILRSLKPNLIRVWSLRGISKESSMKRWSWFIMITHLLLHHSASIMTWPFHLLVRSTFLRVAFTWLLKNNKKMMAF